MEIPIQRRGTGARKRDFLKRVTLEWSTDGCLGFGEAEGKVGQGEQRHRTGRCYSYGSRDTAQDGACVHQISGCTGRARQEKSLDKGTDGHRKKGGMMSFPDRSTSFGHIYPS